VPEVELPRRLLGEEDRRGVAAVAPSGLVDEVGEASYIPPIGSEGDDEPKEMAKGEREKRRERKEVRAIFSSSSSSFSLSLARAGALSLSLSLSLSALFL